MNLKTRRISPHGKETTTITSIRSIIKIDGATLENLLAYYKGNRLKQFQQKHHKKQPKQEVAQPKAKVTKASLFQDRNRQVIPCVHV